MTKVMRRSGEEVSKNFLAAFFESISVETSRESSFVGCESFRYLGNSCVVASPLSHRAEQSLPISILRIFQRFFLVTTSPQVKTYWRSSRAVKNRTPYFFNWGSFRPGAKKQRGSSTHALRH